MLWAFLQASQCAGKSLPNTASKYAGPPMSMVFLVLGRKCLCSHLVVFALNQSAQATMLSIGACLYELLARKFLQLHLQFYSFICRFIVLTGKSLSHAVQGLYFNLVYKNTSGPLEMAPFSFLGHLLPPQAPPSPAQAACSPSTAYLLICSSYLPQFEGLFLRRSLLDTVSL